MLVPQSSPNPPVSREGDGALCQEVTGECMWLPPPSVRNALSQCVESNRAVNQGERERS